MAAQFDKTLKWEKQLPLPSRLDFSERNVIVAFGDSIQILSGIVAEFSGLTLWAGKESQIGCRSFGRMASPDGRLIFATEDNRYHCIDLSRQCVLWSASSPLEKPVALRKSRGASDVLPAGDMFFTGIT